MIDALKGILVRKEPMSVSIDVNGVSYLVNISLQTFDSLPAEGTEITLLTVLNVREDAMQLFGFLHESERQMFRQFQSISGIGPKMALNILSGCSADELRDYVLTGNIGALTTIPGIGKKTAERIIVELKDKLGKGTVPETVFAQTKSGDNRTEALMALLALGYSRQAAEQAVIKAMQGEGSHNTSELIRSALKLISR